MSQKKLTTYMYRAIAQAGLKYCPKCEIPKPVEAFYKGVRRNRAGNNYLQDVCKDCVAKRNKLSTYKTTQMQNRKYMLKAKYQLTPEKFENLLQEQNNQCAVCFGELDSNRIRIDHDHNTGLVRALLCNRCNTGLGFIEDKTFRKQARRYLEHFKTPNFGVNELEVS